MARELTDEEAADSGSLLLMFARLASSERALSGIAFGGSEFLIVLRNSNEEAQRLIHRVGVWEDICDVGLQPDNVAKSLAARTELPNPEISQIILRPKIFF